jgi:GntR family transcriptional regulator, transcriptional repressor for pyruvate dehydrogenase complex
LRTGIEVEAAGLAAERAGAADLRDIAAAHAAIGRAIERGESAIDQDFAFHRSIAEATRNPQFPRFLEYLGRFIIPRQTIRVAGGAPERLAYLRTIQKEHLAILKAIRAKSVRKARAAMHSHLSNSRKRYQRLAAHHSESR